VSKLSTDNVKEIALKLVDMCADADDSIRDIASLALKTVFSNISPDNMPGTRPLADQMVPLVLKQMVKDAAVELLVEHCGLISLLLKRFGRFVSTAHVDKITTTSFTLLKHARAVVKKKACLLMGDLVEWTDDAKFASIVQTLNKDLAKASAENAKTIVACFTQVCKRDTRLAAYVESFVPAILSMLHKQNQDEELRENCLQCLEACTSMKVEMALYAVETMDAAIALLSFDPNYEQEDDMEQDDVVDDAEASDDVDMEDAQGSDEDYDDEDDFSDDDDQSWKIRRASAKLLSALIDASVLHESVLYHRLAQVIVARLSEREETVRLEIINALSKLVQQAKSFSPATDDTLEVSNAATTDNHDTRSKRRRVERVVPAEPVVSNHPLASLIPSIVKKLSAKMNQPKDTLTRQAAFLLFTSMIKDLGVHLTKRQFSLVFPSVETALRDEGKAGANVNTSQLKIDCLLFLYAVFTHHSADVVTNVPKLAHLIILCIQDRFYKICAEALSVASALTRLLSVQADDASSTNIRLMYDAVLEQAVKDKVDREIRDRSLSSLGLMCQVAADKIEFSKAFTTILSKCKIETIQTAALRALLAALDTELVQFTQHPHVVDDISTTLAELIPSTRRAVKLLALNATFTLLKRHPSTLQEHHVRPLLHKVFQDLTGDDLQIFAVSLRCIAVLITLAYSAVVTFVQHTVMPSAIGWSCHPFTGMAGDALYVVFAAYVHNNPSEFRTTINAVLGNVDKIASLDSEKQRSAFENLAKCAAACCLEALKGELGEMTLWLIEQRDDVDKARLSALVLGEIGRQQDLQEFTPFDCLYGKMTALFMADKDDVRQHAAIALGRLASGSLLAFVPSILNDIQTKTQHVYHYLVAMKEAIVSAHDVDTLITLSQDIWNILLSVDLSDETNRILVAESVSKLILCSEFTFIAQLESLCDHQDDALRSVAALALKYIIADDQTLVHSNHRVFSKMVSLVRDPSIQVQKNALSGINTCIHRRPLVVQQGPVHTLLPLLYQSTIVRKELITTIDMGPFKYEVDNGADIRKLANECMYALLECCLNKIDMDAFLTCLTNTLKDQHDIKQLSFLSLIRVCHLDPVTLSKHLNDFIVPFQAILDVKHKESTVKQEKEKYDDLVQSMMRAIADMMANPSIKSNKTFDDFYKTSIQFGKFKEVYERVQADLAAKHATE
jgi:cullin-associated NEDD8-dissociated protein 1